jgi:flagellar biosynthesis anti-sigma factor FlgM
MKIINSKLEGPAVANRAGRSRSYGAASGKGSSTAAHSSADTVELSRDGAGLSEAIHKMASEGLPSASPARLADLREAVQNGTYEINTTALAEAILRDDLSAPGGGG